MNYPKCIKSILLIGIACMMISLYAAEQAFASTAKISFSTYLGGTNADFPADIAFDRFGYIYIVGTTRANDFPMVNAVQKRKRMGDDAFITKIDPGGRKIIYSTYLGGSGIDSALGVVVDPGGNAYVVGWTTSPDFPVSNALQTSLKGGIDVFITKFDPVGKILISTYFGASGSDLGMGIAYRKGKIYVCGNTSSIDLPLLLPWQKKAYGDDSFLAIFDHQRFTLQYSSYIGGSNPESCSGIAVDGAGFIYLAGSTESSNFPLVNALQMRLKGIRDAFVMKFNPSGSSVIYSTYIGGNFLDDATGIAVDKFGKAHVVGTTNSRDFPVYQAVQPQPPSSFDNGFVFKLNTTGSQFIYSTYLGGSTGNDRASAISVTPSGRAYVTGNVSSQDFPIKNSLQSLNKGVGRPTSDAYITKFSKMGRILFSTFLGGTFGEVGKAIAVNGIGKTYCLGTTNSTDFPLRRPTQSEHSNLGAEDDAFVTTIVFE